MPVITQKLGFDARGANTSLLSLTKNLDNATKALTRLKVSSSHAQLTMQKIPKTLDTTNKKTAEVTTSWKTMARVVQTQIVVRSLSKVIQKLEEAVEKARELGTAIEEIQTISGRGTTSEQLGASILTMSDAIGKSAKDLAEANYQTISNQVVEVGESLNFTSEAAKLATITTASTKDAVNALSSVMNSYGMAASEASHVSDTLFKTVELGRLRLSDLGNTIGRVTPLTSAMGVSWEETAAAIAVMTRQGVRADTAITQLRAVMTKMIRPTEELQAIFHKWGVEDGRQAIETFGGLGEVLKKLAKETGGSSSKMAELLRRVRTIVGYMSIMTDEGEQLAETLRKIGDVAGVSAREWEEFSKSDAHKLTVAMNELDNNLTRIGITSLPAVTRGFDFLNIAVKGTSYQFDILTKGITRTLDAIATEAAAKRVAGINKLWDASLQKQLKQYDSLENASGRYYADLQKQEFELIRVRDGAIKRAGNALQSQGKNIVSFYKDSLKELDSFVDKINDKIKSSTQKIADIQRDINQKALDQKLDAAVGANNKLRILERAYDKQRSKDAKTYGAVSASEESKERAIAENKTSQALAAQALSVAKQTKNRGIIAKWNHKSLQVLRDEQAIHEKYVKQLEKVKPLAEKVQTYLKKDVADLEAATKQWVELHKSGALISDDPERKANAEKELADLEKVMKGTFKDFSVADEFLNSLGIEKNFKAVEAALTNSMNQAHKDWVTEVKMAEAAFAQMKIDFKLDYDPAGVQKQFADTAGLEQGEKETGGTYARRLDKAAVDVQKQGLSIQNEVNKLTNERNASLNLAANMGQDINRAEEQAMGRLSWLNQAARERTLEASKLNTAIKLGITATATGHTLSVQEISALRQRVALAHENNSITAQDANTQQLKINHLELAVQKQREINAVEKARPTKEIEASAQKVVDKLKAQEAATKKASEAAKVIDTKLKGAATGAKKLSSAAKESKTSLEGAKTSATGVKTETETIGPSAAAQVGSVNSLTEAYHRLAAAARAAAAAASSAGGTATAYHGGPMSRYFADGGIVPRGQDRIPTALSRGETVINSRNSKRFFSELNAMNQGSQPVYREQGGTVTNVGDVNVTVNGGDSSQQTVREIGRALRREVQRGNIKLT